jgi:23S rRNA (guanine745-N1)-methyltransferase
VGAVLDDVLGFLVCPVCGGDLRIDDSVVRCAQGHGFDVARQGYVSFLTGRAGPRTADTAEMVLAREAFLDAGHYAPLAELVAGRAAELDPGGPGCVLDSGAGSGHLLAAVLERLSRRAGLALDASKHALRRAARAHPLIGAVGCDVWRPLPVRSGAATLVLDVLSPRAGAELRRALRPDGSLLVVTPGPGHLGELVEALGLLSVDERKEDRLQRSLGPHFRLMGREERSWELALSRADAENAALMGPSARHVDPDDLREQTAPLADPMAVTAAFVVSIYRPV